MVGVLCFTFYIELSLDEVSLSPAHFPASPVFWTVHLGIRV